MRARRISLSFRNSRGAFFNYLSGALLWRRVERADAIDGFDVAGVCSRAQDETDGRVRLAVGARHECTDRVVDENSHLDFDILKQRPGVA